MEISTEIFDDRIDGGRRLADRLSSLASSGEQRVVLGIPRGGVMVAAEVAEKLGAPLDVIIARKIRAPHQPELGIGAVVNGEHIAILNEEIVRAVGATPAYVKKEIALQEDEIDRRLHYYRGGRPPTDVSGKTAIVVDDGIATGYTFRAALEGLRRKGPGRLIAAAPVAAQDSSEMLKAFADEVICLRIPPYFRAVGYWYRNFAEVGDEEVMAILRRAWSRRLPEVA